MSICSRIEAVIAEYAGVTEPLTPETHFANDLRFDSLDLISLAMLIEDEFAVEIPDADVDLPELGTLGGVCEYVEAKLVKAAVDRSWRDVMPSVTLAADGIYRPKAVA